MRADQHNDEELKISRGKKGEAVKKDKADKKLAEVVKVRLQVKHANANPNATGVVKHG